MTWFKDLVAAGAEVLQSKYTLKSNWGSLHSSLFATIAPCDKDGNVTAGAVSVTAPLIDSADMQQQFSWQSPFENYTADAKHPTLAAALQSGLISQATEAIGAAGSAGSMAAEAVKPLAEIFAQAEGRTGITKLNSRQVFVGHEPLKIDITMAFRAYQDPVSEVIQPIKALWAMPYPAELAEDVLTETVKAGNNADTSKMDVLLTALFPSEAPQYVALTYKGETYKPLVIESISRPLINPYSAFGDIYATVQLTLGTHRSWDRKDVQNTSSSAVSKLVDSTVNAVSSLFKK